MLMDDPDRLAAFQKMENELLAAMKEGKREVTYTLPVMTWLQLLDEVKDREPRNMSRLIRDDTLERMNSVIDRLDEEVAFLIVHGPASVSSRFDPNRTRHKKDMASANLKRAMREKDSR